MRCALADLIATLALFGLHDPQIAQTPLEGPQEPFPEVGEGLAHVTGFPVLHAGIREGQHPALPSPAGQQLGRHPEVFPEPGTTGLELVDGDGIDNPRKEGRTRFRVVDTWDKPCRRAGHAA